MQLRGHDGRKARIWHSVGDYLDDVRRAASDFAEPPILVGHSLGGLLVQKHLARHSAAGAVLMGSVPARGAFAALMRIARRHPWVVLKANLSLSLRPFISTRALVRELYLSPASPAPLVDTTMERLGNESFRMFLQVLWTRWRAPISPLPVLVLGAEHDGFFTAAEVEATARLYGTHAEMFAMGHDMMLDTGWEKVADRIDAWVREIAPMRAADTRASV